MKNFDSNLLKLDKKSDKNIDIYYIGCIAIKKIGDYKNIHSVNPLYLIIGKAGGLIEKSNDNKYLVFHVVFHRQKQRGIRKVHKTLG